MSGLSRRRLLQAMGLAGGTLFLPSLRGRSQAEAPPKRLVIVFTQHGFVYDTFRLRPAGTGAGDFDVPFSQIDNAQLSPLLQPLAAHKQKLLVLDGLSLASCEGDIAFNGHDLGTRGALTGAPIVQEGGVIGAGGASFDQLIARQISVPGRLPSLEFAVDFVGASGSAVYRDRMAPLPPELDPRAAFSRLFPPPANTGELTDADRVRAAQASVLDLVADQYDAIVPRLSGEDRQKLSLHRDLVRDAERRVIDLSNIVCQRPSEPQVDNNFNNNSFYESRYNAFVDITAAALACDLTRVVTLQLSELRNDHLDITGDVHADFAHNSEENQTSKDVMTRYGQVHARHLARLLDTLDAIPEGNGTLLDNTAVLWCSELATGTHKFSVWPAIIAGGAGGALRTGRYMRFALNTPNPTQNPGFGGDRLIGRPHNHLLLSLATALGASLSEIGGRELSVSSEFGGGRVNLTTPLNAILV